MPVLGSKPTDSRRLRLDAHSTQTLEYYFYFPVPSDGALQHYPVHVSKSGQAAGAAKPFTFRVVSKLSTIDKTSWPYISQDGTNDEVLAFLEKNNVQRFDLTQIAWRVRRDPAFFRKILEVLRTRHLYQDTLFAYAVVHNDRDALSEWLRHRNDFIGRCGPFLDTALVRIDPIERRAYEHLEYSPLINQRMHRLGSENRIPNPVFRAQYQSLLNIIAHKAAPTPEDQMSLVYYLFLQDRVEEALAWLGGIKPDSLPTRLQYDYFRCFAAFYEEKLADARAIASQYSAYPVPRWRNVFSEALAQLDEIDRRASAPRAGKVDDKPDREAQQSELAATEPSFNFKIEDRQIKLNWQNLQQVQINYYLMDPEFLFSASPFATDDPARFAIVRPALSQKQALPERETHVELALPEQFQRANLLIEVVGAGQRKVQPHQANDLRLKLVENYGRLDLREAGTGAPLPRSYVKVYARLKDGQIRFYKDGYTDLRGIFDYASLNSTTNPGVPPPVPAPTGEGTTTYQPLRPEEIGSVEKLSLLVLTEKHGAATREVGPPAE
jgi:hypothetical protein